MAKYWDGRAADDRSRVLAASYAEELGRIDQRIVVLTGLAPGTELSNLR